MKLKRKISMVLLILVAALVMLFFPEEDFCGAPVGINMFHGDWTHVWNIEKIEQASLERQREVQRLNRYVLQLLDSMTLEEKLAQMMILTNEKDITEKTLKAYQPGGVIFFGKDFKGKTVKQVKKRVEALQLTMDIPLFIGIDEEGGDVSRISGMKGKDIPVFESARVLYETGGVEAVQEETEKKTAFLKEMGINLNFDPVADVVEDETSYMYNRAASGDAGSVAEYVEAVVTGLQEENMGCCLKHFPGYGENENTHTSYAVDRRKLGVYRERDFIPFERGIAVGADMVMVSHIVMGAVDKDSLASLSRKVHKLLREEMEFDRVIIADDLNMKAILNEMALEEATGAALAAGNDMIFSADLEASMKGAGKAVEKGRLSLQQIDESVTRIIKMKINRGLVKVP